MKKLEDQAKLIYRFFDENEKALLIVLDACNWKILAYLKPDWNVNLVQSRGSGTSEWMQRSFPKPLKDVVYISSNPYIYLFKKVRKNFKHVIDLYLLCWNNELQTVSPKVVNLFVKENIVAGEKKLIAHYMQPHPPFLVDTWLNIYAHDFRKDMKELKIYDLARKSFETRKEFVKAYIKNLDIVVEYVELLIKSIRAIEENFKVVITSDHSEVLRGVYSPFNEFRKRFWLWVPWLLGIYRYVGHENKSKLMQLYEVPWIKL